MLEIFFGSLVDSLIIILLIQQMQAQDPQPSCIYNKEGNLPSIHGSFRDINESIMLADCHITREKDHCLSDSKYVHFDTNGCEIFTYLMESNSKHTYVNAAINCSRREINTILLLEKEVETCWNVQVTGGGYPYKIVVNNLPVFSKSSDHNNAFVAGILNNDSCVSSGKDCRQLATSNLSIDQIPTKNQLHLTLKVKVDAVYKVEMLSGDCNITCDGNQSKCKVNIEYENVLNLTSKERTVINFKDVTPSRHYCARIGTEDDCCYVYTITMKIDDKNETENPVLSFEIISTISILILVVFVISMTFLFLYKLHNFIKSQNSAMQQPAEEGGNALVLERQIIQIIDEMRENMEVYLVYPYDCQDILDLISSFRQLLQRYVRKVWDPFSDEDTESFSQNIPITVQRLVTNPNIRIIIIETEEAVMTERHLIEGQLKLSGHYNHFLNDAYLNSLDLLMNNIDLKSDYARLFIVRLHSDINGILNIMRDRRYLMPDHFETLIYYMSRSNIDFQDFTRYIHRSEEQEEFINKMKIYNRQYR